MNVSVVSVGQVLNFETGKVDNQAVLRLPGGAEVKATVSDEAAAAFVAAFAQQAGQEAVEQEVRATVRRIEAAEKPQFVERVTEEGEEAYVFGNEPVEDAAPPVRPAPADVAPSPKRKHRLIGKDSAGNPIVEFLDDSVAPEEVTGTVGQKDEDGVASV